MNLFKHLRVNGNKKGFTLIELLVVISIIAILLAIIYPSFNDARKKARDTRRETDLSLLSVGLRNFAEKHGRYPSSADGTCNFYDSFGTNGCLKVLVTEGFVQELPVDPLGGSYTGNPHTDRMYFYDNWCNVPAASNKQYRLWGNGELKHDGLKNNWWNDETIGVTTCSDPS